MPLILLLLKATVILAAALGATLVMHRASAGSRHLVWLVAFGSLMLLPLVAAWSPLHLAVLPAAPLMATAPRTTPLAGDVPAPPLAADPAPTPGTNNPGNNMSAPAEHSIVTTLVQGTRILFLGWAAVAALLLGWLAYGAFMVRRIVRRAVPLTDQAWQGQLYEIADRLGLDEAPRLLRSADVKMPFACGLTHCTIVLPAESDEWTAERRGAVLIHELGHVRRRDLLGHTISRIACAIYWFHPLVWTAARHLRSESERACDDLALTLGERPSDYAEHLLDIVTCVRNHATPSIALAMAHRKEFEGRMLAILDPELRRASPTRRQAFALTGMVALLAVAISASAPVARATVATQKRTTQPDVAATIETPAPPAAAASSSPVAVAEKPLPTAAPSVPEPSMQDVDSNSRALALVATLRTDSVASVRRVAAWALRNYDDVPAVRDALLYALQNDADARVREMSAWSLTEISGAAVGIGLGTAARTDRAESVREMAVWAIGSRGDPTDVHLLSDALVDTRASVRGTAAWGLGQLSPKRAPQALLTALNDSSADVRLKAAWATLQIGDSSALPALRQAMRREKTPEVQRALIRALIADGEDPERMVEWLRSPDAELRELAARSLAGDGRGGPWPWPWPRPKPGP